MSRNYRKEYDNYHSKPEQKIRRAARNAARARFKDADPKKDVHHKDNNPLNNDKKNLSLVTQHYNRREPRLRKEEDFQEAPLVANEVAVAQLIADKFYGMLMKGDFKKKQKLAKQVGIKISQHHKRVRVEELESAVHEGALPKLQGQYFRNKVAQAMQTVGRQDASGLQRKTIYKASDQMRKSTRAFQLHFDTVRDTETQGLIVKGLRQVMDKKDIFFVWDSKFAKRLTTFKEDMGTVTGPHIAGTGDDSSTVKVRKKKKVHRRKDEGSRLSGKMTDWEKRQQLSKQVRQNFWKNLKGKKKKDVNVKFKLKNSKSLKKRVIDNVLAIQQKV